MQKNFIKIFIIITLAIIINSCALFSDKNEEFVYKRDFNNLLIESKDKSSQLYYPKLLSRFNSNDSTLTNLEIITLLIGFTADSNYKPYETIRKERAILELVTNEKYDEAITKCNEILDSNPVNFIALMEKGFSLMKLNNKDIAFHKEKVMKIKKAILWSGEGTVAKPYFVLGPIDGQILIRYILGGTIGEMGSGLDKNGHFLDILEMNKNNKSVRQHFIIEHAKKQMMEQMFQTK